MNMFGPWHVHHRPRFLTPNHSSGIGSWLGSWRQVMSDAGPGIAGDDALEHARQFRRRAVWGGKGKMLARLGFYCAEHVGSAATSVLVIALGEVARPRRSRRPQLRMNRDWFFVQANHRFVSFNARHHAYA
jgi:hypothetical protein